MSSWEETAAKKRASVFLKIPSEWRLPESFCAPPTTPHSPNLDVTTDEFFLERLPSQARLTVKEVTITSEINIPELLKKYKSQELLAEEVVTAFCHRAAVTHQMTESIAEIRFEEAIAEAKAQDDYLKTSKKLVGPLHGIPISLKDQFRVKGLETAMGYIGWLGHLESAETESFLVKQIVGLGGIIIAKTHVPQTLMLAESVSNLHPPGLNPYNRLLSPGGSSGGEGSLVGSHSSVLGVGCDMGGSVRIPSAFNNLFGLKPSHGRLSYKNVANSLAGKPAVPSVVGPMASTVDNLLHFTKAIIDTQGWNLDPALINMPWRQDVVDTVRSKSESGGLCFATYPFDKIIRPHPPVARGMETALAAVRRAGHKVIEWEPPSHLDATNIYAGLNFATFYDIHEATQLSGEPLMKGVQALHDLVVPPNGVDIKQYYELVLQLRKYQERYAEYWESTKALTGTGRPVDGIITPVASTAAVRHNKFFAYSYTIPWNILDYSSVTVPVSFVDKSMDINNRTVDESDLPVTPYSTMDQMNWAAYNSEIYHGAPIGVQVVARRLEEEKVLALGEVLSKALAAARDQQDRLKL